MPHYQFPSRLLILLSRATALLACLVLLAGCVSRKPAAPAATTQPFIREVNLVSFDNVFDRIAESYYDPARLQSKEIDWENARLRLRPKVENATNINQVRAAMSEALSLLGETHFSIIPAEVQERLEPDAPDGSGDSAESESGTLGIHVRLSDDMPIVASVDPGSAADLAGVKAGWAIDAIDGKRFDKEIAQIRASFGESALTSVRIIGFLESHLSPSVGESVRVRFISSNGKRRVIKLASRPLSGGWASFGNLPAMNLRFDARKLPDNIGYFSLSVFLSPPQVIPAFSAFIKDNQEANGIVIDLRGNPGGLGAMAMGMCGFLIAEDGKRLGTMIRRDGELQFIVNPRYPQFSGPVAVLVDTLSMSTSEILAGGLQDLGRARVFGQPTPGAALPSTIARLPNGDGLQYAMADYVSASGRRLEGKGITPDEIIPLDRSALEAGLDPTLEAACAWIEQQAATRPATTPAP